MVSVPLVQSAGLTWQRLEQQLGESCIIRVAGRTVTIWEDPLRVLRQQSIVHLALELRISGNFDSHKATLLSSSPDVLALVQRIKDAIPSRLEVKDRHIKDQHWIVPAPAKWQELPPARMPVHIALTKIAYFHCFGCELAREDEQAKKADQESQNGAQQGKPGGEIPLMTFSCIHSFISRRLDDSLVV
jgi:hypothetical protein